MNEQERNFWRYIRSNYGFLIQRNSKCTLPELAEMIVATYDKDQPVIKAVVQFLMAYQNWTVRRDFSGTTYTERIS